MNILNIIGIVLAGGTIAFDHLIHELPHWFAVVLFTIAIIMIIAGMIRSRTQSSVAAHTDLRSPFREGVPEDMNIA